LNSIGKRLGAIAMLAASFTLAALVIRFQPLVEREIRSLGLSAYPLAIFIFTIVASAPFSVTDALAIMNGAIFGPVKGSIVNAIGLARVPAWVRRFPVGSPAFLLAVRIIPGFGGTVATASAATFRVPVWRHVWTMCAIAIPICTILAIFGDRVTVVVHNYEHRAHVYWEAHRPHLHFPHRVKVTPTP
jgi:uncharacterized membrane protein YdjX (TVP38/TMEM64 family)